MSQCVAKNSVKNGVPVKSAHGRAFRDGAKDGIPIGLGYFAVAFSLGIAAKEAGLNAFQGFIASFFNNASAGEYAGFTVIAADAAYWEMALITLIANARYILMSCALSQRFPEKTGFFHRLVVAFDVTDEIFGITIARPGFADPYYSYGAMAVAIPCWATGTALGVAAGSILPEIVVNALGVALYGMFLAVIIPPSRTNKRIAATVAAGFILSFAAAYLPFVSEISGGMRTIILTVVISAAAALIFPVKEEDENAA